VAQPNDVQDFVRAGGSNKPTYMALTVRVKSPKEVTHVEEAIKKMGYSTFSLLDATRSLRLVFTVFDLFLGLFGSLALTVASLGIINDITERRMKTDQLERMVAERTAALRESNADLETFSYSISHDLRAPLRAMQGFSQILFEDLRDKLQPHHLQYMRRIMASANRMDNLISDVLAYTRVVRSDLALVPVDLDQLVHDIVQTYPHLRSEKADLQIEGPLHPVLGNEAALTQCISNLLGNAVKFVPIGKRPVVRVRSELKDEHVLLWVEDNGIGIAPEHQGRIFEMFNRLDTQYEGTGIGLTIVRKAVERMGGKVGLESTPGEGTRFWIQLKPAVLPTPDADQSDTPRLAHAIHTV